MPSEPATGSELRALIAYRREYTSGRRERGTFSAGDIVQPARGTNARFTYRGDGPAGTSDQLFELAATADADSHDAGAAAAQSRDVSLPLSSCGNAHKQ